MKESEEWVKLYRDRQDERPIEYRFVWDSLLEPKEGWRKILDVGCIESGICKILSNLGYDVTGIDIRDYEKLMGGKPNFKFYQEDIRESNFAYNSFDQILCISTLEHIGIKAYGNEVIVKDGDFKAMEMMKNILKPNGNFLLTVPFGSHEDNYWMRYYKIERLTNLLDPFKLIKMEFYKKITNKIPHEWVKCSVNEAKIMGVDTGGLPKAIACVKLSK